jgi:hypothetical protein
MSDKIKFGNKIGELVYEGYSPHCIIKNVNEIIGHEFIV